MHLPELSSLRIPSTGSYDDSKQDNEESQHGPESQEMGHVKRFKQRPQHGDIQFHGSFPLVFRIRCRTSSWIREATGACSLAMPTGAISRFWRKPNHNGSCM